MGFQPKIKRSSSVQVYNKHHKNAPSDAVYIGRPTKWGNPFSHLEGTAANFKVANRDEAVEAYKAWLLGHPTLLAEAKKELNGKSLVCWCAPHRCHGDVLLKLVNDLKMDIK